MSGTYLDSHATSMTDPDAFWLAESAAIDWEVPPTIGVDTSDAPFYRWFSDGRMNTCYTRLIGTSMLGGAITSP